MKTRLSLMLLGGLLLVAFWATNISAAPQAVCGMKGRYYNPLTDVDYTAVFPIKLGEITLAPGGADQVASGPGASPLCCCSNPFPYTGLRLKLWEPIGLIETTRSPFCFQSLGGQQMYQGSTFGQGTSDNQDAFYHTHYIKYPVFFILNIFMDFACLSVDSVDIGMVTEVDPAWSNDSLALLIHNPEAVLFGNTVTQLACSLDCGFMNFSPTTNSYDMMFWCSGCLGGAYPLNGHTGTSEGSVVDGQLIASRTVFLLSRLLMLYQNVGKDMLCPLYVPTGTWTKSQFRLQPSMPFARTAGPVGYMNPIREMGRAIPAVGEDYVFTLWQKRDCCMIVVPLLTCS